MLLSFSLCLPRDGSSVPFVRHHCRSTLERLGVEKTCIDDIEVALSEAVTNVFKHAHETDDEYEVRVTIDNEVCKIEVSDAGPVFEYDPDPPDFPTRAETGRGISLMRALVDDLEFVRRAEGGTKVVLSKVLSLRSASMLHRLRLARETEAKRDGGN
jgi:serine/threonine-protein kinase RsbW